MGGGILGRDDELAAIRGFVRAAEGGLTALLIEGAAGIGKSTLWEAGVEEAEAAGMQTLVARPAEAEQELANAGLGDLLAGVVDDVLPLLASPRRRALEAALLLGAPTEAVDRRAVAVAVGDVLQLLAAEARVLVAVDDVQWLDPSTVHALAFALRRLSGGGISLLVARRTRAGSADECELTHDLKDVAKVTVGSLTVGALHSVLLERLGHPFPRQTLLHIHERTDGNPFFALELARVAGSDLDPRRPIPVPATVDELLRARVGKLPSPTRAALELASALGSATDDLLDRAGITAEVLKPALAAGLIARTDETIRFAHPMLASFLYGDIVDRRKVHARVARLIDDPIAQAQHLALAARGPSEEVAGRLDQAAGVAARRGASAAAAALAESAWRLTPTTKRDMKRRRLLAAARAHHVAGEWPRAVRLARSLLEEASGALRAQALLLLAELEPAESALVCLEEALAVASDSPALKAEIHCRLAWAARFGSGLDHARAARSLAEQLDDDDLRARADAVHAVLAWFLGRTDAPPVAAALPRTFVRAIGGDQLVQEGTQAVVNTLAPAPTRASIRQALADELDEWRERDEPRVAHARWGLAWLEFWAGRWEEAEAHAVAAHDVSIQYGLERPQDHLPLAVIAVHQGRLEVAREHSQRALGLAREQLGFHPPQHIAVVALAARWSGDGPGGLAGLERATNRAREFRWREPSVRWWTGDQVEALLEVGRRDEAASLLAEWDADAERVGRDWVRAHAQRCRALIVASDGDLAGAVALLEDAVSAHLVLDDPYGCARAELALGGVRRRTRSKRAARESIETSLRRFEELGARTWVAAARAELGRIGGRSRGEGLTAAEQRVAELVAEGKTNREVAAALFLGERTVASHLTHIYAKLGVRSRTQLARKVQTF
jgi:DNA-binding CsgD family transcriptional regulator